MIRLLSNARQWISPRHETRADEPHTPTWIIGADLPVTIAFTYSATAFRVLCYLSLRLSINIIRANVTELAMAIKMVFSPYGWMIVIMPSAI